MYLCIHINFKSILCRIWLLIIAGCMIFGCTQKSKGPISIPPPKSIREKDVLATKNKNMNDSVLNPSEQPNSGLGEQKTEVHDSSSTIEKKSENE